MKIVQKHRNVEQKKGPLGGRLTVHGWHFTVYVPSILGGLHSGFVSQNRVPRAQKEKEEIYNESQPLGDAPEQFKSRYVLTISFS